MTGEPGPAQVVDGRERVLTSALSLFASRTYGRTTTKSIAEHAGVATGLVFYHFESKGALLRAILAERTFGPDLRAAVTELGPDPQEGLTALGRRLLQLARAGADFTTVLMGSREVAPDLYASFQADLDDATAALGRQLGAALEVKPSRARNAARAFMGCVLSSAMLFPSRGSDRTVARAATDIVLHGCES